ncbi:MAG: 23S rRNA (uracil(1939)-C(5))-methyltransferase RlmD, partial [Oscillospiraceae bacterium]|nr:23S rRNA (uracil(1939)-C(5))-methyltransferase RlmD [Oscillospiraceae bacterium]
VDPPRKGLDAERPAIIADMAPGRLVYVSCDPATLARDCARFAALGFTIETVQPVDMFPRTSHVETVCLLTHN